MYELALFLHILAAITFFAGMAVAAVALVGARKRERPAEIAALLRLTRYGVLLVAVGGVAVIAFGFWLVAETAWSLSDGWLSASFLLIAVSLVAGAFGGRRPKRARELAEAQAGEERAREELRALLDDRASDVLNAVAALAAIGVLALMVWRP